MGVGKYAFLGVAGLLTLSYCQAAKVDPEEFVDQTIDNTEGVANWLAETGTVVLKKISEELNNDNP